MKEAGPCSPTLIQTAICAINVLLGHCYSRWPAFAVLVSRLEIPRFEIPRLRADTLDSASGFAPEHILDVSRLRPDNLDCVSDTLNSIILASKQT